jgi:hypothetical protein
MFRYTEHCLKRNEYRKCYSVIIFLMNWKMVLLKKLWLHF